ncbi:hypothetical protein SAMD00023353_12800070 [Rosellinia necatrix]|uniref:Uncharacterized protein n=1 Tax=Rosellinia necatrix TaxID=77044 RepID=A0A1S8ABB1_ROSNE|nr:hypothetical protein SAMD00023353_12800070 [Rosellinia necatrix]
MMPLPISKALTIIITAGTIIAPELNHLFKLVHDNHDRVFYTDMHKELQRVLD